MAPQDQATSQTANGFTAEEFEVEAPSPREVMRRRAKRHFGLIIGGSVVSITIICAVFAPLIAPFDPFEQDLTRRLINPVWGEGGTWAHPLGTDGFGRDLLSRLIFGAQISLTTRIFRGQYCGGGRFHHRDDWRVFPAAGSMRSSCI